MARIAPFCLLVGGEVAVVLGKFAVRKFQPRSVNSVVRSKQHRSSNRAREQGCQWRGIHGSSRQGPARPPCIFCAATVVLLLKLTMGTSILKQSNRSCNHNHNYNHNAQRLTAAPNPSFDYHKPS